MLDDLDGAAVVERDDRQPHRHRLDEHEPERLLVRRHGEHVGGRHQRRRRRGADRGSARGRRGRARRRARAARRRTPGPSASPTTSRPTSGHRLAARPTARISSAGPFSGNSRQTVPTTGVSSRDAELPAHVRRARVRAPTRSTSMPLSTTWTRAGSMPAVDERAGDERRRWRRARRRGQRPAQHPAHPRRVVADVDVDHASGTGEPGDEDRGEGVARAVAGVDDADAPAAHEPAEQPDDARHGGQRRNSPATLPTAGWRRELAAEVDRDDVHVGHVADRLVRRRRGRHRRDVRQATWTLVRHRSRWRMIWAWIHVSAPSGGSRRRVDVQYVGRAVRPAGVRHQAECIARPDRGSESATPGRQQQARMELALDEKWPGCCCTSWRPGRCQPTRSSVRTRSTEAIPVRSSLRW